MASLIGTPPDVPACTNLGDHGWCRYPISKVSFFIDDGTGHSYMDLSGKLVKAGLWHDPDANKNFTWDQLVHVSVIVPAYSFSRIKAWSDNVCHQVNCSNGVGSWSEVMGDINNHTAAKFKKP